jgi:hypothetical protein
LLIRFRNVVILVKENAAYLVSAAGISSTLGTQKVHHPSTFEIKVKFNRDEIHKGQFDENLICDFWQLAHSQLGFFFSILGIPSTLGLYPGFMSHCFKVKY